MAAIRNHAPVVSQRTHAIMHITPEDRRAIVLAAQRFISMPNVSIESAVVELTKKQLRLHGEYLPQRLRVVASAMAAPLINQRLLLIARRAATAQEVAAH